MSTEHAYFPASVSCTIWWGASPLKTYHIIKVIHGAVRHRLKLTRGAHQLDAFSGGVLLSVVKRYLASIAALATATITPNGLR